MQYTEEEYKAFGIQPPSKKEQKPTASSEYTAEEYKAFGIEPPKQTVAAPVQPAVKPQQPQETQEAQPVAFDQLYKDSNNFNKIQSYALSRFGEKEKFDPAKETQEEYVKRFASHMRMARDNLLSSGQELAFIAKAKREDVLKAKEVYDLFENTAGYFSSEGQKGVRPILDVLGSIASDPVNLISAGVGSIAKSAFTKTVAKEGMQAAIKSRLGALSAVPIVEGLGAAAQNATTQKIELSTDKAKLDRLKELLPKLTPDQVEKVQPEITALEDKVKAGVSGAQVAIAGGIGAVTGTLETGSILAAGKAARLLQGENVTTTGTLKDVLDSKRQATGLASPKIEVKATDPTMKSLEDAYDIFEGQKLLAKEGSPTAIAQMQIRNDINEKAAIIAQDIWKDMPSLAPKAEEKVSDAIKRTLSDVDTINDDQFMKSLSAADVTPEEFAKMFRASVGDAGRTLQSLSVIKRLENKMRGIDPAAARELDAMYGGRNALTSAFVGLRDVGMRVDRELKALMVSQLATTIRNGFSGAAVVTFGTVSEAIESSLYRIGKTVSELATGTPVTGSFTGGLKGVYDDALRTIYYLRRGDLSSDAADELLKGTPSLMRIIAKTAGETEAKNLSKPAQIANTLNVAQDSFFRKAIFTASVEKQLSRAGVDMYDVMAQGKQVPFDVLRNATDEALTATFSKMPTKGPMFHAVKFVEELGPIGSTVIPFPRFMANAMSWTYKHSPMGIFSGAADIAKGSLLLKQGNEEGQKYLMQGLENTSKGSVGLAAIYASYKYRQENQDGNWYDIKNPDGSTVDARVLFPLAPFLAMGDYLVKLNQGRTDEFKSKELFEAMTGFKVPAGTQSWLSDKFAESISNMQTGEGSADTKVSTFLGEWAGEYFGRALVPVQQISDIIGAIDRNETLPRDAYQIPAGEEGFVSSVTNQLMKRTPILKQQLPVYQPATREEAAFNDSGVLKMFTGIAIKGNPSEVENEITRLKIAPNKIFTSTGDKIVDAAARKVMAPLLIQVYDTVSKTDYYKQSSQDVQKIMLGNTLNFVQKTAKEIATNQSMAKAFNEGQQPRIFAIKYAALPAEVRRATADMYKQQTGKELTDTKAYMEAMSYANVIKGLPGFAKGGFVRMAGGGAAAKVVGDLLQVGAKKATKDILQEVEEMVIKNEASGIIPKVAKTAQQTNQLLSPTEAPKTVSKAVNPADVAPSIDQTEAALPAVSGNKAVVAPVPETPTAFSDYQLQEAEKSLVSKMGSQYQVDAYKKAFPEDYQNSLNKLAVDVEPTAKVEPVTSATKATKETKQVDLPLEQQTVENTNLNKPKFASTIDRLNSTMSQIRDIRTQAFDTLKESPLITEKGISEDALAVAQGDWRMKTKTELNVNDPQEVQKFATFAEGYQKKLEALREKYKDRPPEILYHGKDTERTPAKIKRGFLKPQDFDAKHIELGIPAPSFTRDLRLNYNTPEFGGVYPKNISQIEIPFADYLFRRVDMSLDAYKLKDKNVMAQTITGSPTIARPLGLPRSFGYRESEDAFVEADKLVMKTDFDTVRKKYRQFDVQARIQSKIWDKLGKDRKALQYLIGDKQELAAANTAYGNIRDLFKNEMIDTGTEKAAKSSLTLPSTGSSQTMLKRFEVLSRNPDLDLIPLIDDTIDALNRSGVKDKSLVLKDLRNQLKVLKQDVPNELPKEKEDILQRNKAVNTIRELIGGERKIPARLTDSEGPASQYPKNVKRLGLAKGGLASRR